MLPYSARSAKSRDDAARLHYLPPMRLESAFAWLSVILAAVAAVLWLASALVDIPTDSLTVRWDSPVDAAAMQSAMAKAAALNKWAALMTGLSVAFQAISLALSRR